MPDTPYIISQGGDFDWLNLLWILIVLVFPALNALGEYVRKASAKKKAEKEGTGESQEFEVVVEGGEMVLKPHKTADKPTPARPSKPQPIGQPDARRPARPAPPAFKPAPAKPVRPPRPAPGPPQPAAQSPRPASAPAPPSRPHPARKAPPARAARPGSPTDPRAIMATMIEERADKTRSKKPAATDRKRSPIQWDRDSLRQAIIMKEILGPPIALRRPGDDTVSL